jgi:hypothetical protein
VDQIAPNLVAFVRLAGNRMIVEHAFMNNSWVAEIRGAPSIPAITEFLDL